MIRFNSLCSQFVTCIALAGGIISNATAETKYGAFELTSIEQLARTDDKLCDPGTGYFSASINVQTAPKQVSINGHTVPMFGVSKREVAGNHTLIFSPATTRTGKLASFLLVDVSADCRYHFKFVEKPAQS